VSRGESDRYTTSRKVNIVQREKSTTKKISKSFEKPLDKSPTMWYNISTVRENKTLLNIKIFIKELHTMSTTKKLTKRDHFNALLSIEDVKSNEVLVDFINHELELLAKKNSAEKKPTATQVANDGIKTAILNGMEEGKLYTITDLIKSIPEIADLTNQRISALVRQLIVDGKVERIEEKRKAYFRLA